jgi:hypothetical protein
MAGVRALPSQSTTKLPSMKQTTSQRGLGTSPKKSDATASTAAISPFKGWNNSTNAYKGLSPTKSKKDLPSKTGQSNKKSPVKSKSPVKKVKKQATRPKEEESKAPKETIPKSHFDDSFHEQESLEPLDESINIETDCNLFGPQGREQVEEEEP